MQGSLKTFRRCSSAELDQSILRFFLRFARKSASWEGQAYVVYRVCPKTALQHHLREFVLTRHLVARVLYTNRRILSGVLRAPTWNTPATAHARAHTRILTD